METRATVKLNGIHLYEYKRSDAQYETLKNAVCRQLPRVLRGRRLCAFAGMFCLFAAETFRRQYTGGPWTWDIVFAEAGHAAPPQPLISQWVSEGLQRWRRPLLEDHSGKHMYLVTLVCEGGLPLRLLHRENAHLSRYFRELLTVYHRKRHTPDECNTTEMAPQIAARYLPASLRNEIVFRLSSDLIQSIVQLQERVPDASDPIAELNSIEPDWRKNLPLPVEDATVDILLRNLMGHARDLAQTKQQ